MDKSIKLNLSSGDLSLVLNSLGQLPYYQVASLINHIQSEVGPQLVAETKSSQESSDAQNKNLKSVSGQ